MHAFLERFGSVVTGILQGFDRLVFKGRLRRLYYGEGMHTLLRMNEVHRWDFKTYAASQSTKILTSPVVERARREQRFRYLNSSQVSKEDLAREMAAEQQVQEGLVCVLQCVEPCWTFQPRKDADGLWEIRGQSGKCSHLYHYCLHPQFGWMYLRLQTWFPFEIQVGINGREWLARQLERENLSYDRSDNKFRWIENWPRAQELMDEQVQTNWVRELNALQKQFHPTHPRLLGAMPLAYNWTVAQSEWATDVAFASEQVLQSLFDRWLRQAFLNFSSVDVLRFLGRSRQITKNYPERLETSFYDRFDGKRIKYWLEENSLKLYIHFNVLRSEMTINRPERIKVLRRTANDPKFAPLRYPLRRGVVDLPLRAQVGTEANQRHLDAVAGLSETRSLKDLTEPLTRRVPAPQGKSDRPQRYVRGLNPLASADAALLAAVSDPRWMIQGMRNRDLVAVLYPQETEDVMQRRRRSAHVTRLLRLLRAHGLLDKIAGTHRYQLSGDARLKVQALLAARNANPDELASKAA